MAQPYDIAVLGATPGGLAAAYMIARKGLRVVVVDAPGDDAACPLSEWVGKDTFALRHMPRNLARATGGKSFRSVVYHGPEGQLAEHTSRGSLGHLVPAGGLAKALRAAATRAGAVVKTCASWPKIHLAEETVSLTPPRANARLLLIAQNRPGKICADLALSTGNLNESGRVARGLDIPLDRAVSPGAARLHVVQLPDHAGIGLCFPAGAVVHVRVIATHEAPADGSTLSRLIALLQAAEVLERKLPLSKARGAIWYPPAGTAMEMETHVAKRCLLTGTAGGFAETISGHTVRPSVESSLAAAETLLKALTAKVPQTVLMRFKTTWRKALADYLRPPNTSLDMLMPLLFVNRRITAKFTDALLYGRNI